MVDVIFLMMGGGEEGGGAGISLIFIALMFVVFYFFLIRPQSKRQKAIRDKVSSMKKGDKVVTSSGIIGTVNQIDEASLLVDVDTNVKIRFLKSAITDVNPPQQQK